MNAATALPTSANRRHAVELGPVAARLLVGWLFVVSATAVVTSIVGWRIGAPFSRFADTLLWPGSILAFFVLGSAPRRGGPLVGAFAGAVVGVLSAAVVAILPLEALPVTGTEQHRWHYIVEALGTAP